jgi:hypothetical protein
MIESAEIRLFLEAILADLLFFQHLTDGVNAEAIRIEPEAYLAKGAFADIRVIPGPSAPYFVEVKVGYSLEQVLESVGRKYGAGSIAAERGSRLTLVVDSALRAAHPDLEAAIRAELAPPIGLSLWTEQDVLAHLARQFGVTVTSLDPAGLLTLRQAVDRAKGLHAFGERFSGSALETSLLWQLAFWRLRRLRDRGRDDPRAVLVPGSYREVVVLFADLCSYSSYVRDTRDERIIQASLTSFSTKSRYRVINDGGLLYQFQGDSVIAFFGVPEQIRRRRGAGAGVRSRPRRHRRLGGRRVAASDRPHPDGRRRPHRADDRYPRDAVASPVESHAHGGGGRCDQPGSPPQRACRLRRGRREQHLLPAASSGGATGFRRDATGRSEEHRLRA